MLGALSLIHSPITTSPQMFIRSNMPRMASLAAASAAALSPRARQRNELSGAASVAGAKSSSMMRPLARRRIPDYRGNTQLGSRDKNRAVVHNVGASQPRDQRRDQSANGRVRVVRQ